MIRTDLSKQKHHSPFIALTLALILCQSWAAEASGQKSQVLKIDGHKRLEASICPDAMNRIAVANDRITQIFGDEGTFENQNDEATGQVFLKPTVENASKSLSLTLITEQGLTQDLTLHPTAKSAKTLVLMRDPANEETLGSSSGVRMPSDNSHFPEAAFQPTTADSRRSSHFKKAYPFQEELLEILKQAIRGQLPVSEEGRSLNPSFSETLGYTLTPEQSWQMGPYVVHALTVENITHTALELQEKDFYQAGDVDTRVFDMRVLALSLSRRILGPQGKATLYVVGFQNPGSSAGGLS